ncbi:ArsR family transcriptional regulator [Natronococcus pandeyae]|uniref:ArsR family transcriptional regulator n=1 Tax=Natronococcus pandeyae TaxID=2055836 RepID=A0A8J8Q6L7_9EURY|nr:transcriptional regulator FilR1 domain-containing protein [Natronococcus pandeyae]TYL38594.1 ArsR family transcriptional regulator [Natronococcus pandeyae]
MESALEEIEFLALSANRVEVLSLLAERRHRRNELAEATGASQATLGRILGDFEKRSWIRRDEEAYVATATGRIVASGFTDLQEILEAEMRLREVVDYLPTHAMDVDLRRLADATITVPSQTRPNAPLSRLLGLLRDGNEVRTFSHAFNEQTLAVVQERTATGDQRFRGVFSRNAIDALTDEPELAQRLRTLLETETVEIRVRDEGVPIAAMIVDDVVYLLLRDENGVLRASIDTDDRAVRSWAEDTYDHYWRTAKPLEPDAFST